MSTAPTQRFTVEEYLALEQVAEINHEYLDGEIFGMAGGTEAHSLISGNLVRELGNALKGSSCRVYQSDMRLWCPTGLYTYPDSSVVCDQSQFSDDGRTTLLNPLVIVEVLLESTEAYDRGRKFAHYRMIDSLREYVLIAQDRLQVDHFARQADGRWVLTTATELSAAVEFPVLGCSVPLSEIYANITLTP